MAGAVTISPLSRHEHFLQTGDSVTGAQESPADNCGQWGEDEVELGRGWDGVGAARLKIETNITIGHASSKQENV